MLLRMMKPVYNFIYSFLVLTEGYPHLGATSTIVANYCYCIIYFNSIVNHYELKVLYGFYHQAKQRYFNIVVLTF